MAEHAIVVTDPFPGPSAAAAAVRAAVLAAANRDHPVLLVGPPGSPLERLAAAIHARSARASGPFLSLACAVLPAALALVELVGREGAPGRIAQAAGGTLLLAEVGDLRAEAQAAVRDALRSSVARIVASSTKDLTVAGEHGRFDHALLAELSAHTIEVPALRTRIADLPATVERFVATHRRSLEGEVPALSESAFERLAAHEWRGDVGELEAVLDRALALARGGRLEAGDLQFADQPTDESEQSVERSYFKSAVAAFERGLIITALRDAGGNRSRAAELLGIYRRLLYAKIKEYGLEGYPRKPK